MTLFNNSIFIGVTLEMLKGFGDNSHPTAGGGDSLVSNSGGASSSESIGNLIMTIVDYVNIFIRDKYFFRSSIW